MDIDEIDIKELSINDLTEDMLNDFNRYQEVTRVWRIENDKLVIKYLRFIEDWDINDKQQLIFGEFKNTLLNNGTIIGAYLKGKLIGFASLGGELLGKQKEYIQLLELYVSYEYRGNRIGRLLFERCIEKLSVLGIRKLYISSHSAVETKSFYEKMGCAEAKWIYDKQVKLEPYDCQLEYEI